ncbi:hypothetical protein SAY86_024728 [Trapa natans]|uniref:Uncharacterized protein n=1 Tax=Trapa natans TaxID=22666 RepID=A0AAN7LZQ3_TRANT|nr:hypothetical protein SAY86_024728 [Trapa natans]
MERNKRDLTTSDKIIADGHELFDKGENDFSFHCERTTREEDEEVIESKIRAFLDEKALQLKKLQTPLYEEFYNTINAADAAAILGTQYSEKVAKAPNFPPKSRSPHHVSSRRFFVVTSSSLASPGKRLPAAGASVGGRAENELLCDSQKKLSSPRWKFKRPLSSFTSSPGLLYINIASILV